MTQPTLTAQIKQLEADAGVVLIDRRSRPVRTTPAGELVLSRAREMLSIVERLEGKDDKKRTYSYSILAGPLPVAGYKATLHVEENTDGKSCTVDWSSSFEPAGASDPEAVKVIRGIYEAGFENLRKMFGK